MIKKVYEPKSPGALSDFVWGMRKMSEAKKSQKVFDLAIDIMLDPRKVVGLRYDSEKYRQLRTEYGGSAAACQGLACACLLIEEERDDA